MEKRSGGPHFVEKIGIEKQNKIDNQPKIAFKGGGPHFVGKVGIEKDLEQKPEGPQLCWKDCL